MYVLIISVYLYLGKWTLKRVSFSKINQFNFARTRVRIRRKVILIRNTDFCAIFFSPPSEEARIGCFFSVDIRWNVSEMDPDFKWFRIQSGSRVLMTKNWWKNTAENFFKIKNWNLLMSKLQEKPSALKREHPALQKIRFVSCFPCLWVIFAPLLDPNTDPVTPIESGSTTLEFLYIFLYSGEEYFCPVRGETRG